VDKFKILIIQDEAAAIEAMRQAKSMPSTRFLLNALRPCKKQIPKYYKF